MCGSRVDRSPESCRHQLRRFILREWLQVEAVQLATFPHFLYRWGNGLVVANGEDYFRGAPLHDLMEHERRQVVEQVHVVDTENSRGVPRPEALSDAITP